MIEYDQDDLHSLALVAWKEARGERAMCVSQGLAPTDGMRAVMHVLVNRVGQPGFASTIHNCIYGKNQFTSMSVPSDPEFNLEPADDDEVFGDALALAGTVLGGTDTDNTQGASYYADLKYTTSGWFWRNIVCNSAHPVLATIGHHSFYL